MITVNDTFMGLFNLYLFILQTVAKHLLDPVLGGSLSLPALHTPRRYGFPPNCPAGAFDTEQTLGKKPEGTDEEDRQHRKHTFLRLHTRARRRKAGAPGLTHWPRHAQPQWLMPSLHSHPHRCTVMSTDTPITLTHTPHTGGDSGVTSGASPADRKIVAWGTWPQEVTSWAARDLAPSSLNGYSPFAQTPGHRGSGNREDGPVWLMRCFVDGKGGCGVGRMGEG